MASTYLTKTGSTGDSRRIFTHSVWVKRCTVSKTDADMIINSAIDESNQYYFELEGNSVGDDNDIRIRQLSSGSVNTLIKTSASFRDVSAWYHIVVAVDTTQATASNRIKLYVNGSQITSFDSSTYPSQNTDMEINTTSYTNYIGTRNTTGSHYFDGSMAHVHFIDGTAYDATAFGEFDANGIWTPNASPSVTYGTNGFFLDMASSGDMGNDVSGNNNDFTVNGTVTQALDTPSNVFCTMNSLIPQNPSSSWTFSNGNTTTTSVNTVSIALSTLGFSKGKWYWEIKVGAEVPAGLMAGIAKEGININSAYLGEDAFGYGYFVTGNKYNNGNQGAYGDAMTNGDIISVAYDADNGTIWFARNGTWQNSATQTEIENGTTTNSAFSGLDTTTTYFCSMGNGGSTYTNYTNFGNGYFGTTAVASGNADSAGLGIFEYTVPSGYYSLCTKNLAEFG